MTDKILTTTIRNQTVLAKLYNGVAYPKTFANRTQAENAAAKVGGTVWQPFGSRPWFVCVGA
jgi:hypothetical protein